MQVPWLFVVVCVVQQHEAQRGAAAAQRSEAS